MAKSKTKKRRHEPVNGKNINAPRVFEDGELVLFIQRIYGTSMCFGTGVISQATDLPSGYALDQQDRVQYLIKGRRVFFHEGQRREEHGTFRSWLGSASIVIVPRTIKSQQWLKESMRRWKTVLADYDKALALMRFTP